MNDRLKDSPRPASDEDEAFLGRGVRALKDDFPDEERMRSLEARLSPVFDADPAPPRWWQRRNLRILVGAVVVVVGVGFMGRHAKSTAAPLPPMRVESPLSSPSGAPAIVADVPAVAVDSLPTAAPPPASETTSKPEPKPAPRSMASEVAPAVAADDDGDELAILEEARSALGANPGRALSLADAHAKRFRKPAFAQERERLAIDALVRLGRRGDASERAKRFEARYPESAHLDRVRALVAPRANP